MSLEAALLERLSGLVGRRDLSQAEFQDWLAGAENGGPQGGGLYPLTDSTGFVRLVASPARMATIAASVPRSLNGDAPAVPQEILLADTTAAGFTVTLPAEGGIVTILDAGGAFDVHPLLIDGAGRTIAGEAIWAANLPFYRYVLQSTATEWAIVDMVEV